MTIHSFIQLNTAQATLKANGQGWNEKFNVITSGIACVRQENLSLLPGQEYQEENQVLRMKVSYLSHGGSARCAKSIFGPQQDGTLPNLQQVTQALEGRAANRTLFEGASARVLRECKRESSTNS